MTQKELNYIEDIHKLESLINNILNIYLEYDLSSETLDLLNSQNKTHENNIKDIENMLGEN